MKRLLFLTAVLLLSVRMVSAGGIVTVSLDSLVQAAMRSDEQQKIIGWEKEKALLDLKKLNSSFLPEIDLNGLYNHQSEVAELSIPAPTPTGGTIQAGVYDQYDFSLQLKEMLFSGFSRMYQRGTIRTSMEEQEYRLQYRKKEVLFQVYSGTYRYLYNLMSLKSLDNSIERLRIQRQRVTAFFREGFASSIDTLEISGRIHEIMLRKTAMRSSIKQALRDLEFLSGISRIDSVYIDRECIRSDKPETENILSRIDNNFNLRILDFNSRKLNFSKKSSFSEYFPRMYLFCAYHYGKPGVNFFEDEWMDYWTVGVQLNWNIWNWGKNRATLRQKELSLRQIASQKKTGRQAARTNSEKYLEQLDQFNHQRDILATMIREKKEKYNLMKQQWEQGGLSTLDLLQGEKELTETEMEKDLIGIQSEITKLMLNRETGFSFPFPGPGSALSNSFQSVENPLWESGNSRSVNNGGQE